MLIVMWSQFAFVKERASNYWNKVTRPKVHAVMSPTSVAKVPEWVRDLYTRAALPPTMTTHSCSVECAKATSVFFVHLVCRLPSSPVTFTTSNVHCGYLMLHVLACSHRSIATARTSSPTAALW